MLLEIYYADAVGHVAIYVATIDVYVATARVADASHIHTAVKEKVVSELFFQLKLL